MRDHRSTRQPAYDIGPTIAIEIGHKIAFLITVQLGVVAK